MAAFFEKLCEDLDLKEDNAPETELASKTFWSAARNNIIDIDNFHKAFDEFFDDEVKNLFGPDGMLLHRGTYGVIKGLDPEQWATKALKKLWALQFVDHAKTTAQLEDEKRRAEEAEKRRIEKEEQARLEKEKELEREARRAEEFNAGLDMETINKVLELAPKPNNYIVPKYENHRYYITDKSFYSDISVSKALELINKYYAEALSIVESEKTYESCEWFKVFKAWLNNLPNADYCDFIFQDKLNKIYHKQVRVGRYYADDIYKFVYDLSKDGLPVDAELVVFKSNSSYSTGSTYSDSYYYTWISISNKASQAALDKAGFSLEADDDEGGWGESSGWKEVTKEEAAKADGKYIIDGMDKWYTSTYTSWATD